MILKSLKLTNVKCYDQMKIDFVPGKNIIIGDNGSGKSTIVQSILYSLFSEYPEGKKSQLVRSGEDVARFRLEFEQDGTEYLLTRKLRAIGSPEATLTNKTVVDLVADTQSRVTQEIQSISQIRKEVFQDVIIVRQGEIAKIIDMQPHDRKKLFDKFLGIHDFEISHQRCNILQRMLGDRVGRLEELIGSKKESADKFLSRKKELATLIDTLKQNQSELSKLTTKRVPLEQKEKNLGKLEEKIKILAPSVAQQEAHLEKQRNQALEDKTAISKLCENVGLKFPKIFTIERLTLLESKIIAKLEIAKKDLARSSEKQLDLIKTKTNLERHIVKSGELITEIEDISSVVEEEKSFTIKHLPEIETQANDQWLYHIQEKIKSEKKKRVGIQRGLRKATKLEATIQSISHMVQEFQERRTSYVTKISKNNEDAKELGPERWRSIVQEDASKYQEKLNDIIKRESETKQHYEDLLKKVSKTEKHVEDLKKAISELSGLIGTICPKCKQAVDAKHAKKISTEVKEELRTTTESLTIIENELNETNQLAEQMSNEAVELRYRIELVEKLHPFSRTEKYLKSELTSIKGKLKKSSEDLRKSKSELSKMKVKILRIDEKKIDAWIDLLSEIKQKVKTLIKSKKKLKDLQKKLDNVLKQISELEIITPEISLDDIGIKISSLNDDQLSLSSVVEQVRTLKKLVLDIDSIQKQFVTDKQSLENLEEGHNPNEHKLLVDDLQSIRDSEISLQTEIRIISQDRLPKAEEIFEESKSASEDIEEFKLDYHQTNDAMAVLLKLTEFYREIQLPLRHRDVTRAANHASQIFQLLTNSTEFGRILITEHHNLLVSRFGKMEPLKTLSGGEQVIACLSIRLGFARALANKDLIILDEPTTFLDQQRRTELIDALDRVSPTKQMLIVTHNDEFEKLADKLIRVEKDASSHLSKVK